MQLSKSPYIISILISLFVLLLFHANTFASKEKKEFVNAKENHKCQICHGHRIYSFYNDWTEKQVKKLMPYELMVDSVDYYNSAHWDFKCVDCHVEEYKTFPHEGELRMEEIYACIDCHGDDDNWSKYHFETIEEEMMNSVHSSDEIENFSCWNCHDPHTYKLEIRNTTDLLITIENNNKACLKCHSNGDVYGLLSDSIMPDMNEVHQWLPNQNLHYKKVRCLECHVQIEDSLLVGHKILPVDESVKKCSECHSKNSILMTSLYKFKSLEDRKNKGFYNAIILNESYVIGATRNYYFNLLSLLIFGLTLLGIIVHVILRVINKGNLKYESHLQNPYSPWIRIWHLVNALLFIILILSGISMQYSNPDYPFIRFDLAVSMHNIGGVLLTLSYLAFIVGNLITPNGRFYKIKLKGTMVRLKKQFNYYLKGMFKGEYEPFVLSEDRKFNPLQKVSYVLIMFVVFPILIITGIALIFPEFIVTRVYHYSGILLTALLHSVVSFILSIFMIVHIYFSTIGNSAGSNFKSILIGRQKGL